MQLNKMSIVDFKSVMKETLKINIDRLKENSKIVNQQLLECDYGFGKCKLNQDGLINLLLMKGLYALSIEIKENVNERQGEAFTNKKGKRIPEPAEWFMRLWKETCKK